MKKIPSHRGQVSSVPVIVLWKPYLSQRYELMWVEHICPMPLTTGLEPRVTLTLVLPNHSVVLLTTMHNYSYEQVTFKEGDRSHKSFTCLDP